MTNPPYVKPRPEQLLADLTRRFGPPVYVHDPKKTGILNEAFIAGLYATEHHILHEAWVKDFYQFSGKIYEPIETSQIINAIDERMLKAAQDWPGYPQLAELRAHRHLSGVVIKLQGQVHQKGAFDKERDYIHLHNGVLLFDYENQTVKLHSFSPQLVSRNLIPIDYDAHAKCARFVKELLGPLDSDDREILQRMCGMYLSGLNTLHRILILEGAPASGKSQLAIVIKEILGAANCAELRTRLLDGRFEIGSYLGRTLVIGADVSGNFLNQDGVSRLKALTGGDLLSGEMKNGNRRVDMVGLFNALITCNSRQLVTREGDRGAWRRQLISLLYGSAGYTKIIPHFGHLLVQEEGPGILNWFIEGCLKLRADIESFGDLTLTREQQGRVDSLLDESDGLRLFIQNHLTPSETGDLTTDEIVAAYSAYCKPRKWVPRIKIIERNLPDIMLEEFHLRPSKHISRGDPPKDLRGYSGVELVL